MCVGVLQNTQSENALTTFCTSANIIYGISSTLCEKIYTNKAAKKKICNRSRLMCIGDLYAKVI